MLHSVSRPPQMVYIILHNFSIHDFTSFTIHFTIFILNVSFIFHFETPYLARINKSSAQMHRARKDGFHTNSIKIELC